MFIITNIKTPQDNEKAASIISNLDCVGNGGTRLRFDWFLGNTIGIYAKGDARYPGIIPPGCTAKNYLWFIMDTSAYTKDADFVLDIHNTNVMKIDEYKDDDEQVLLLN